jgi:O-antigen/teichoic acid export membrane protein
VICGLYGLRVLTGVLGPSIFGEVNLYMTISILMSMLIFGPLTNGIQRICSMAISNNQAEYFLYMINKVYVIIGFALLSLFLFLTLGSNFFNLEFNFNKSLSVVLFAILSGISAGYIALLNILEQRLCYSFIQGVLPWFRIIFALCLLHEVNYDKLALFFYGYLIAEITLLTISLYLIREKIQSLKKNLTSSNSIFSENKIDYYSSLKSYTTPFIFWGLFSWIQSSADRWAIQLFSSSESLGNYIVLWQLGFYPITIASGVVMQYILPMLYKFNNANEFKNHDFISFKRLYFKIIKFSLGIYMLIFFVSVFFHKYILILVTSKEFDLQTSFLPFVILSSSLISLSQIFALVFNVSLNTKRLFPFQVSLPLFMLIVLFVSAYFFQLKGVIFGMLFYACIYFSIIATYSLKELKSLKVGCL